MKLFVILCTFLFTLFCGAQEHDPYEALESVRMRALCRGIDLAPLIEAHIDSIYVLEPKQFPKPKDTTQISIVFAQAHFKRIRKRKKYWDIRISRELLTDYNLLERIIAHELGHTLGISHCCEQEASKCKAEFICLEIMSVGHLTKDDGKFLYFYNKQWNEKYWDNYFKLIKNL